ncbi:hypothetical protein GGF37_006089 [Kickxella alabastrina]|nr:hypothetical protein GGF37_006089 [Kickxella alabastrina]
MSAAAATSVADEQKDHAQKPAPAAVPASVPLTNVWKVADQSTAASDKTNVTADTTSWPDPATAAATAGSDSTVQSQTLLTAGKQQQQPAKKGKGKWMPLEAEIQYPKPKNAAQHPSTQRQPKQQQHQQAGQQPQSGNNKQSAASGSAKDSSDTAAAKGPKPANAHKKNSRSDNSSHGQNIHSNSNSDGSHQQQTQAQSHGQQQQGRNQRSAGRGRGRGRGQNHNVAQTRRTGPRIAGHAPSHYQGKGNVQIGGFAPLPFPPPVAGDEQSVVDFVRAQVEYYFSVDNLCKDIFFRTQMDTDGFVPLTLIAGFNRLKIVTTDLELIRGALDASEQVELGETRDRVRKRGDWATWLFPSPEVVQQQQQQSDALKSE